jgi:hypothetical protein
MQPSRRAAFHSCAVPRAEARSIAFISVWTLPSGARSTTSADARHVHNGVPQARAHAHHHRDPIGPEHFAAVLNRSAGEHLVEIGAGGCRDGDRPDAARTVRVPQPSGVGDPARLPAAT